MYCQISNKGILLLQQLEGFRSYPYLDSANIATIGNGTTYYPNDMDVTIHDKPITQSYATECLIYALKRVQSWLNKIIIQYKLTPNQCQFDAMCLFFYNVGYEAFQQKDPNTWVDLISNNLSQFANDMLLFNKIRVNGVSQVCNGLNNRRKAEFNLFNS